MSIAVDIPNRVEKLVLSYYSENDLRLQWTPPPNSPQGVNILYVVHITDMTSNITQVCAVFKKQEED